STSGAVAGRTNALRSFCDMPRGPPELADSADYVSPAVFVTQQEVATEADTRTLEKSEQVGGASPSASSETAVTWIAATSPRGNQPIMVPTPNKFRMHFP